MKTLISLALLLATTVSFAKTRITDIKWSAYKNEATVRIKLDGKLKTTPSLQFKSDTIQVTVPESVVWPQISKKIKSNKDGLRNTKLMAYQFDKGTVRVRTILPYEINNIVNDVSLDVKTNELVVTFPIQKKVALSAPVKKIDQKYLDKLLDEGELAKINKKEKPRSAKKENEKESDIVNTALSAIKKTGKSGASNFSFVTYVFKFVAFLGVVLLVFYGVVTFLKKGVSSKSKLSFLGSTKQVEVLNTTYVSPKKTLLLIRAHKQIFLVSNTDQGMQLISEISDPAGLIKGEVQDLSGMNFDTNLNDATTDNNLEDKVTLKKNINESKEKESLADFIGNKAKEVAQTTKKNKYSDKIKKKAKELKPLQ